MTDPNVEHLASIYQQIIDGLELSGTDELTATRHIRALIELTSGTREIAEHHLQRRFPNKTSTCLITVSGIEFHSLCSHHMLPISGTATVGYRPDDGADIVGLSKIPRFVRSLAARPLTQEWLTQEIVAVLDSTLNTVGSAVAIRATHTCMSARGVKAEGTSMVTAASTLSPDDQRSFDMIASEIIRG